MAKTSLIGKTVGKRYVIEEMLGQGGMSAVYKATDPNLKRVVAIKVIHPHLSDNQDFVKRFEEEAAAVAQLRHPGIILVHDFNKDDELDLYYMVLEFVPGETIQDHLKRLNDQGRKLSVSKALEFMANICDAVDYAHQRGMIHRDIKPANLMLTTTGQAILMDFGIAKIVGGQRHTATGAVVGTAMYMSPEQIKGEQPDRRSDIYSLGVTLFEMLSGKPPFDADSAMTLMMMHINDPVPNPQKLNPEIPEGVVDVVNKALEKNPADRFQTAAQMAAALRNALAGRVAGPVPSSRSTMVEDAPTMMKNVQSTTVEPVSAPRGTVVESSPMQPQARGTMVESAPQQTPYTAPSSQPAAKSKSRSMLPVLAGVGVLLICLVGGGFFLFNQFLGGGNATEPPVIPTNTLDLATEAPVLPPTEIVIPTDTAIPLTATPSTPYVVILGIRVEGLLYAVDYEVHNFPEGSNLHVHMFFNTVPPEQAGSPGSGPWKLTWGQYGNPPFTQYTLANRPPDATQLCALVANPNHSIQLNSGNCIDLPPQ
jgi:serine/threonine protein kinase